MKIAVRGGHNFQATGACGIIDETREDRKVKDAVIKYLRQAGHSVLDVTPGNCGVMTDLIYGVEKAEDFGAELFISCHFDKCYDNYNGELGHACWTYSSNGTAADIGRRIVNKVSNGTGLKNRGLKTNPNLYELRKTSMPAVIVEVCFCEATEDVRIYREKGADLIGKLIVEGISQTSINNDKFNDNETYSIESKSIPLWKTSISGEEVKLLQLELNNQGFGNLTVDGYFGDSTLNACPYLKNGSAGNITKLVQQRLINRGYKLNPYGADGVFRQITVDAVEKFQCCFSLYQDGIVGKKTWKALYGLDK